MTAQDYISAGYKLSSHIAQGEIDRAEAEVKAAYVLPIVSTIPATMPSDIKSAVMALTFLLLNQRNQFATRSGQKEKETQSSRKPEAEEVLRQQAHVCHQYVEALRKREGANAKAEVYDVCRIYFKSNYFYV